MNLLLELECTDWQQKLNVEQAEQAIAALEEGKVLVLPRLPFLLQEQEQKFLDERWSDRKAKNISLRPNGELKGAVGSESERRELQTMIERYSKQATQLVSSLFPHYVPYLQPANTSFRPCEVENRVSSYRKDDTRLHTDAFPSNPTQGTRLLRVFSNINPHGQARVWRLGEPFKDMATKFLPKARPMLPGQSWLMQGLGITKRRRTKYDQLMLQLHNNVKGDLEYQQHAPQQRVEFMPGTTWIVYSDQVLHAAMSGQFMLEQTMYLPLKALKRPETAPIRVLEFMLMEP